MDEGLRGFPGVKRNRGLAHRREHHSAKAGAGRRSLSRLLRQQAWLPEGHPTRNSRRNREDRLGKEQDRNDKLRSPDFASAQLGSRRLDQSPAGDRGPARQASGGVAHPRRFRSAEFDHFLARRLRPDRRVGIAAIRAKIGGAGFHARFRRLLGIGAVGRQRRPPARLDAQGLRRPRRQTFRSRRGQQYRLHGRPASRLSASATMPIFRPISPSSRRNPSCPRGCRPIQE